MIKIFKHPSFSVYLLVVTVYFYCSLATTNESQVLVKRNWDEVSKQIETALKGTSSLSETLFRVKELSIVYKDGLPEKVSKVLDKILVSVTKVNADKCNDEYLSENAGLRYENLADFLLILPFLKHNWNKQFEVCKELLKKEIKLEMGNLSESRKNLVRELQEDIINDNNVVDFERKFPSDSSISKGIFSFMRPKLQVSIKRIQDKQTGEVLFHQEFYRIVLGLCSEIKDKINKTPSTYKLFVNHDELRHLDKTVTDWIDYRETCDRILSNRERFANQVYERFKIERVPEAVRKEETHAGWFKCLNCKTSE